MAATSILYFLTVEKYVIRRFGVFCCFTEQQEHLYFRKINYLASFWIIKLIFLS